MNNIEGTLDLCGRNGGCSPMNSMEDFEAYIRYYLFDTSVLNRIESNYENSPKASGFFLILKINSNLPKKTEI